jgi:A/G-specific adenine glycosylase
MGPSSRQTQGGPPHNNPGWNALTWLRVRSVEPLLTRGDWATHFMNSRYRSFSTRLLTWYEKHQRDLPWRRTRDPYRIWISEMLLQQTQVATVIPYYERFIARFPTVEALAAAPLDDVLKTWEGAGYYARARNLHRAAQEIVQTHGGKFPRTVEALLELPGIGRYTAGAIASIAFNRDAPVLDGNVIRVLCRYFGLRGDPRTNATRAELWKIAEDLIPTGRARDFNQALMDLGATVCLPRNPRCALCPVRRGCTANKLGLQNELPTKRAKRELPHYEIGVGIIWKRGRILIQRRPPEGLLGGLWEFPGGKREKHESLAHCVHREVREEVGIEVKVGAERAVVDHGYSHFSITMHAFDCDYVAGRVRLSLRRTPGAGVPGAIAAVRRRSSGRKGLHWATAFKWVRPRELQDYAFPAANRKIIKALSLAKARD